jgi:hypothetical protein
VKKRLRTLRLLGPAVIWMRAHIWLGLLCVPAVVFHSGMRLGGYLTILLVIDFTLVMVSGILGLLLQQWLPRLITEQVAEETIHSLIDEVMKTYAIDTARLIDDLCGSPPKGVTTAIECVSTSERKAAEPLYRTGTFGRVGRVHGTVTATRRAVERVEGAEPLRTFFRDVAADFLLRGSAGKSPLRSPSNAEATFAALRGSLPEPARPLLEVLQGEVSRRRQLDRQAQLHFWLHAWLWLHTPLAAALVVLTAAHVVSVWRY